MSGTRDREEERIREVYRKRRENIPPDRYALHRPEAIHIRSMQLEQLARALAEEGVLPLQNRSILEIGCGYGQWLVDLETMGADRGKMAGIDLDEERIDHARRRLAERRDEHGLLLEPGADLRLGSAAKLPWKDGSFDLILQSTVFTSILDPALKNTVAREMARVLAPNGVIVWYDFRFDNPWNKDVRGIGKKELQALFPRFRCNLRRVTLAPPLSRRLARASRTLATFLEQMKLLNTHYLATLRR